MRLNSKFECVILHASPNAGKTTAARWLESAGFIHFESSEILKEKAGHILSSYKKEGKLVPDEVVVHHSKPVIENLVGDCVLTGFFRTDGQYDSLMPILLRESGYGRIITIHLEIPQSIVQERAALRGREDDAVIDTRLQLYTKETQHLIRKFKKDTEYRLVHNTGSIEELYDKLAPIVFSEGKLLRRDKSLVPA